MLKRIVWVGERAALPRGAAVTAKKKGVQILAMAERAPVPAGVAAVLGATENAVAALNAASTVASWNEDLLKLLAEAVDCREGIVPGSSVRVMEHAHRFGVALGLSADEQFVLGRGALLRDIGKIRISNDVLLKPGVLTYDEWRLIRQHPLYGAEIVRQLGSLSDIAPIVHHHHESYDGDGYPDGLEGESIPLFARVVKIVDVYSAMTSPRLYRAGHMTHEAAIEQLLAERGKHFDAQLVDTFIDARIGQEGTPGKGAKAKRTSSSRRRK